MKKNLLVVLFAFAAFQMNAQKTHYTFGVYVVTEKSSCDKVVFIGKIESHTFTTAELVSYGDFTLQEIGKKYRSLTEDLYIAKDWNCFDEELVRWYSTKSEVLKRKQDDIDYFKEEGYTVYATKH